MDLGTSDSAVTVMCWVTWCQQRGPQPPEELREMRVFKDGKSSGLSCSCPSPREGAERWHRGGLQLQPCVGVEYFLILESQFVQRKPQQRSRIRSLAPGHRRIHKPTFYVPSCSGKEY